MLHGDQRGIYDLSFAIPSECADRLADGRADIGIVPAVELNRQKLNIICGSGIASRGPVRSILLISKVPLSQIRTLATDSSSRTSVALSQIILERKYAVQPQVISLAPDLSSMLSRCDAALVIGDPALAIDPLHVPYRVLDLGDEWTSMTGLPMVFAVWAARSGAPGLSSTTAVHASIEVVRAFVHLRELLGNHAKLARRLDELEARYDGQI